MCTIGQTCTLTYSVYVLIGAVSFQVPRTFLPGHRYRVTVRGLKEIITDETPDAATAAGKTTTFDVLLKGWTEFRAGEGPKKTSHY